LKVIVYARMRDKPQVTYILPRQDAERLPVDRKRLEERRNLVFSKMKAVAAFAESRSRCRMQMIQEYFGEDTEKTCGICDVCIARRKKENLKAYKDLREEILVVMKNEALSVEQLEQRITPEDREMFVDVVRELVDEGVLRYDDVWRLVLSS